MVNTLLAQPGVSEKVTIEGKTYYKHQVKQGETVYAIHKMYGVGVEDIYAKNDGSREGISVGQFLLIPVLTQVVYEQHVVAKKETIYGICSKYNIKQDVLITANPELKNGLKEGQVIRIPIEKEMHEVRSTNQISRPSNNASGRDTVKVKGGVHIIYKDSLVKHVVQKRETLYSLSKRYMVNQDVIREANDGLKDGLKKNDTINIPLRIQLDSILVKEVIPNHTTELPNIERPVTYKDVYNVVVFAPIELAENKRRAQNTRVGEEHEMYKSTKIGVDFYAGIKLALDSLKKSGISVNLAVYDTENDTNVVKKLLLKKEASEADLIIGPFYKKNVSLVAEFAKENQIHMVIPVPQGNKVLYKNPYVSKAVTSTTSRLKGMAAYVAKHYPDANIILVDSKKKRDEYEFNTMREALISELAKYDSYRSEPLISSVENYSAKHLHNSIDKSRPNIIIACSKDRGFATNFMTKVNSIKNSWDKYSAEISVFVLDDWERYNSIDPVAKNKLNMHYVSNHHISYDSTQTIDFLKAFRASFGYDPAEYGFMGFDLTYTYVSALAKFGSSFNYSLSLIRTTGVHTNFNIVQVQEGSGFENRSVYIVKYQDYDLIPVQW